MGGDGGLAQTLVGVRIKNLLLRGFSRIANNNGGFRFLNWVCTNYENDNTYNKVSTM